MALKDISRHYADVMALGGALPAVRIPIGEARGLVLAEDAVARFAIPPFTNSAMDGFALRVEDVTVGEPLTVVGDIPAGCTDIPDLQPGTTLRIMTGAPLPTGADAILQVELTENASANMLPEAPTQIVPTAIPGAGEHIRYAGEDIAAGALAFATGTVLTPAHLAALVALGHADVAVHARPRVGVVTTGDELRAPGEELAPGQIPDSNSVLVAQLAEETGAVPKTFACHTDTPESFLAGLRALADGVDLIVTTGGVSAGVLTWSRRHCSARASCSTRSPCSPVNRRASVPLPTPPAVASRSSASRVTRSRCLSRGSSLVVRFSIHCLVARCLSMKISSGLTLPESRGRARLVVPSSCRACALELERAAWLVAARRVSGCVVTRQMVAW